MNKLLFTMLLVLAAFPARAAGVGGMFGQGSAQFSLIVGSGYAFNNSYSVIGAGASYYVLDGVSVGLSFENWSGNGPGIKKISPSVQYVFNQASSVKPYVGGFYRHAVISGLPSVNSAGARAGVFFASNPNTAFGAGLVYESYLNCQTMIYNSCSETYPEISIIFAF